MGKDLLLLYAKGGDIKNKKHYYINFDVVDGKVKINSVSALKFGNSNVFFRVGLTGEDDVPIDEVEAASKIFIENNEIDTIEGNPWEGLKNNTKFTLNI